MSKIKSKFLHSAQAVVKITKLNKAVNVCIANLKLTKKAYFITYTCTVFLNIIRNCILKVHR